MTELDKAGALKKPLPMVDEPEGEYVPDSLPYIVDGHVHLFPDFLFAPIWQWFDKFGWPVRYQLSSEEIIQYSILNFHFNGGVR